MEERQAFSTASAEAEVRRLQHEIATEEMLWGDADTAKVDRLRILEEQLQRRLSPSPSPTSQSELTELLLACVSRLADLTGIDYMEACTGRSLSGCCGSRVPADFQKLMLVNSSALLAAIEELAGALKQSDPFLAFERARDTFLNDLEINSLRREAEAVQKEFLAAQRDGSLSLELIDRVRSSQRKLRDHPLVACFSQSRLKAHELIQSVNRAIRDGLRLDPAQILSTSGGNCG
jgi:cell fate (sporulation/competence/biofilm development) regulator YlbF (YheA/YmcA/DUF963 family)